MTEEKRNTSIPSDPPSEASRSAAKSRKEALAKQAATTQTLTENEPTTRSKRKADPVPEDKVKTPRKSRKDRSEEKEAATDEKPVRWVQVRILPIYVRILLVIVLLAVAVVLGALIGYSVLGDGAASEIFHKETWMHIFDIMNGKE